MAYVDLDKIINIESGGGVVYPGGEDPAPYPVLSQSIGIFNKPDAWDGDSNGWFGLLNNSNNAVNAQNNNWNTQMALAAVSGTGPLSTRIKSFDFSQNIGQIDGGVVKYGAFANISNITPYFTQLSGPTSWINFDESLKVIDEIDDVSESLVSSQISYVSNHSDFFGGNKKAFIVQSGSNYFLTHINNSFGSSGSIDDNIITLYSYPCDENGIVTGPATSEVIYTGYWDIGIVMYGAVIGVSGNKIFVGRAGGGRLGGDSMFYGKVHIHIYEIGTDGNITAITDKEISSGSGYVTNANVLRSFGGISSYQIGTTIYLYGYGHGDSQSVGSAIGHRTLASIDASITSVVTETVIYTNTLTYNEDDPNPDGRIYGHSNGYYDTTTSKYYVVGADNNIWSIDATGFTDTTNNYYLSSSKYFSMYSKGSKLYTAIENIGVDNNTIKIYGSNCNGTFTDLYKKSTIIVKIDGIEEEDVCVIGMWINTTAQNDTLPDIDIAEVKLNGVLVPNSNSRLFSTQTGNRINAEPALTQSHIKSISLPQQLIGQKHLEVELYTTNARGFPIKLALGATGGTYATPTLPVNNGMSASGNATTPWVPGTDASYINLTLAS